MIENNICPIGSTLDYFNRKWIFCILSNIFRGMKHFSEFKKANPTISNHVLAETLKYMEENDLIEKTIIEENPRVKTEYSLTEKGRKTNKILYEITSYYFNELNYVGYDDSQKEEILKEYEKAFEIR
ncbi:helix-turn-helix domain-containing protein [Methanobrevibacter millerae]|uniref:Transcriptional regulator HxlR family n=1 Tax=Methanobrevibacter millerae TaxID=230361 RepID=A0A0U2TRU2_9EURY|nr:helix-turn-helix domain-containing protein [Methanobrevibacter millerae]ALT68627.1 transcriptional regulator HxlR family [Methanobrevibacter millerae]MBO6110247.1 helix-turn-helix transcriptional regulator [Methanobrevibacter sp.]